MALSFIFDADKGETPASVARKRAVVQALMAAQGGPPKNIGEGLNALGDGIVENVLNRRADAAEQAGQSHAADIFGGLTNAGLFPAAPSAGGGMAAGPGMAAASDGSLPSVDVSKTASGSVDPQAIYTGLKQRGLNDAQIYATLGNWKQESEFRPGAINPGEGAVGFTQWREGRKSSLENFAKATGRSANDPEAQMDFYVREAGIVPDKTGTVVVDPGGAAFAKATDIPGANRALKGFIRYGSPYDKGGEGTRLANALAYQKRFGSASPAVAAVNAEAGGQSHQVASLDPSIGMPAEAPAAQALPAQAPIPEARPAPGVDVGAPGAVTPAGQRVLGTMMDPTPIGGQGAVVQALSAINQPQQAAAAPSPVVQALAAAQQPQQAAPVSPGVQQVAQAMQPPQQAPQAQPDNLPVMAGGSADAIPQGQGGPSVQQIMSVVADPWATPEQKQMANVLLQQKLSQQDPGNQLDMEFKRAQLDALRAKPDQTPESVRALQMRADAAGLVKGSKEYQDFMISGGSKGTNINVDTGTVPQGYQVVRDDQGRVIRYDPIPGGPADTSKSDAAAAENRTTSSDVITGAADKIRTLSKNPLATGMTGALASNLANTDAAEVYRQVDVLKSNATIESLNAMRAASKTGGALGSVTEGENKMLAAKSGALDPKSPHFQEQLDDYERTLLRIVHGKDIGDQIFEQSKMSASPPAGDPQAAPAARPRATNPQTGETLEWDGTQWAPAK